MACLPDMQIVSNLVSIAGLITRRRRVAIIFAMALAVFVGFSEFLLIFVVGNFGTFDAFTEDKTPGSLSLHGYENFTLWADSFFSNPIGILLSLCVVMLSITISRVLLLIVSTRASFASGAEISQHIYDRSLDQTYEEFLRAKSSELVSSATIRVDRLIKSYVFGFINLCSSAIVLLFIICGVLINAELSVLAVIVCLVLFYVLLSLTFSKRIKSHGETMVKYDEVVTNLLIEAGQNKREMQLFAMGRFFKQSYKDAISTQKLAQGSLNIFSGLPRLLLEFVGFCFLIGLVLYFAVSGQSYGVILSQILILAVAAQRSLPFLQICYVGWAGLLGDKKTVVDILKVIGKTKENQKKELFSVQGGNTVRLESVGFAYDTHSPVIESHSFVFRPGVLYCLSGGSGVGKSTLLDLIAGLITPTEGTVGFGQQLLGYTDGLKLEVSYASQNCGLFEATIGQNITLELSNNETVNEERLRQISMVCHLDTKGSNNKISLDYSVVGGGKNLSGGQIQRIGVARALYKESALYLFDEATNSVEKSIEVSIFRYLKNLSKDKIVIVISHDPKVLEFCDEVIALG